jgi:hypothetical protein
MKIKQLAPFSIIAILAALSLATSAQAQGWRYDDGRGYGGYGYRPRCLSSDGINDSLARQGLYPIANVGGDPYGRFIYMRVRRGYQQDIVVTVDGCTGQVVR